MRIKVLSGHYLVTTWMQNTALQDYLGLITSRSNEAFNQSVLPGIWRMLRRYGPAARTTADGG